MKKNNILRSIAFGCCLSVLLGCSSITLKSQQKLLSDDPTTTPVIRLQGVGSLSSAGNDKKNCYPKGVTLLARQVLSREDLYVCPELSRPAASGVNENHEYYAYTFNEGMQDTPLPPDVAESPFIKKLVSYLVDNMDTDISASDLETLIKKDIPSLQARQYNTAVLAHINVAETHNKRHFDRLFFDYMKAYLRGNFVLRNGVKIGKPSGSISMKDGSVNASINNDTLTGLSTVFLESLLDFALDMPIIGETKTKTRYLPCYQPVGVLGKEEICNLADTDDTTKSASTGKYFARLYQSENFTDTTFFTASNAEPTARKFFKLEETREDSSSKKENISKCEAKAIQLISNNLGEVSKAVSGMAFRGFGGISIGLIGEGKFSIGDNEALGKLFETIFEVATRRTSEFSAYKAFKSKNDNPVFCKAIDDKPQGHENLEVQMSHNLTYSAAFASIQHTDEITWPGNEVGPGTGR